MVEVNNENKRSEIPDEALENQSEKGQTPTIIPVRFCFEGDPRGVCEKVEICKDFECMFRKPVGWVSNSGGVDQRGRMEGGKSAD